MLVSNELNDFLKQIITPLKTETAETKPYIEGIFKQFIQNYTDYSKDSLVLKFTQAQESMDFVVFQNLGDWSFFVSSVFDCKNNSVNVVIGKACYSKCYKLINKKWVLFEEMSDNFNYFSSEISNQLRKIEREYHSK